MDSEEVGPKKKQAQSPSRNLISGSRASSSFSDEGSEDVEFDNQVAQGFLDLETKIDDSNVANFSNHTSKFGWKEGNIVVGRSGNEGSSSNLRNAVTIAESGGGSYYSQSLRGVEGSNVGYKDLMVEKGVGFSGRREGSSGTDSVESLRTILSDPVTGVLMEDAMILRCGHSFGSGGLEHVLRMKTCYTCLHGFSEDFAAPNLSLREAVQAFRREEELNASRASKKRRERYDQDKGCYFDSAPSENSRRRGVQFSFLLTDRVIIKGNKRTPPRFVGREAIVVNQCLNGWHVVKTVDNSEQVKLQYRSLAKVLDAHSSKPMS